MKSVILKQEQEGILHELSRSRDVINQFITSCSHSMRGPMKSIKGLVDLLNLVSTDEERAVVLGLIEKSTVQMETMLDELEQFMINSERSVEARRINFKAVVNKVAFRYGELIRKNAIRLTTEIEQSVPFYSDAGRIRLILEHLLANAIQFQKQDVADRQIHVHIMASPEEAVVEVDDNGMGIEPGALQDIFKLFYRATERSAGAGLGLYVVQQTLEKINGTAAVESEPGLGTTFTIRIPNAHSLHP
ncbi:MAG: HAMP domain-containing histidine kinase [Cyclobacteriaceae bacterium]|nr:HAMP domain-containing histidine kinase [Cyclobacteriaceae bacterium]